MPPIETSKRRADPQTMPSQSNSHKRLKTGSIMDYMRPRPSAYSKKPKNAEDKSRNIATKAATMSPYFGAADVETITKSLPEAAADQPDQDEPQCSKSESESKDPPIEQDEPSTSALDASNTLSLTESIGDIFDAPRGTLIIHACNCQGSWGSGIAAAFKHHYLAASRVYAAHCKKHGNDLFGTAQLIPPQKLDRKSHFVGCLYTSRYYGKRKDSPGKILSATGPAMQDLLDQVREWNAEHDEADKVKQVRMCMINSGLFAVPWEKTRALLEKMEVGDDDVTEVKVISREE